jgi:hypothetical protein
MRPLLIKTAFTFTAGNGLNHVNIAFSRNAKLARCAISLFDITEIGLRH